MTGSPPVEPLAIVLLCAAAAGALLWLRKKGLLRFAAGLQRSDKELRVIDRIVLTPNHSLHIVKVGTKTLLVAASPGNCQVLETILSGDEK
jgi:flagellar biogenesis protein FliO